MDLMNGTQLVTEHPALPEVCTWHPFTVPVIGLVILVLLFLAFSGALIEVSTALDFEGLRLLGGLNQLVLICDQGRKHQRRQRQESQRAEIRRPAGEICSKVVCAFVCLTSIANNVFL